MDENRRNWWGWGLENEPPLEARGWFGFLAGHLSPWPDWTLPAPGLEDLNLRPVQLSPELKSELIQALGEDQVVQDRYHRVLHAMGRGYRDLIRIRLGRIPAPPDVVVFPQNHQQVRAVLDIAGHHRAAVIPYGGGSSVVGGVEADPDIRPVISLDLTRMNQLLSLTPTSLTARFEAGIWGPELESRLNAEGFTFGHFPQSFEFSTLGGWIATRGAGHKSNRYGKIEDLVLGFKAAVPGKDLVTPRVPADAAGPDPKALLIGSEGVLGVITEAEIKIRPLPEKEWAEAFLFPDFESGLEALRRIMTAGLSPAALRLSDAMETAALMAEAHEKKTGWFDRLLMDRVGPKYLNFKGVNLDRAALLLVMSEGSERAAGLERKAVGQMCRARGGVSAGTGPARVWHETRYRTPYLRDAMITQGFMVDTLETAAPWERLGVLKQELDRTVAEAMAWSGVKGVVLNHVSHVYPEGANLYLTFIAPQVRGREEEQWRRVKKASMTTILEAGAALSHHHGVGRDHKPWIEHYWGPGLLGAVKAAKGALDPQALLNPGAVFDQAPPQEGPEFESLCFSPWTRRNFFDGLSKAPFDLAIIGGGIVGAGVAWDASIRGLSVVLAEKGDFGSGTSGKSSRMVHGGLRYLKTLDIKLVRESLQERQILMRVAPHLVRPMMHVLPVYKGDGDSKALLHLGLWGYDALAGGKGLAPHKAVSPEEILKLVPAISSEGLEGGLIYFDCLTDDARLTLETIKAAARAGAVTFNHAEVFSLTPEEEFVKLTIRDHIGHQDHEISAKAVVIAAGVWADQVRQTVDPAAPKMLRPAKGIHITFPRNLFAIDTVVLLKGQDGRPIFSVPSGSMVYVGTTDTEFDGDLDHPQATTDEVDYLLDAVNRIKAGPALNRDQVTGSWAGVRPLVSSPDRQGETRDISREHQIHLEHARMVSVSGGKLTTFRLMAAQTVDRVLSILKHEAPPPSVTADLRLFPSERKMAAPNPDWPRPVLDRLRAKYDSNADTILKLARSPWLAAELDRNLGVIRAEVYWAVMGEMSLTLTDVMTRRLGLAYLTSNNGLDLAPKIASTMAPLLGWTDEDLKKQVRGYQEHIGRETSFKQG